MDSNASNSLRYMRLLTPCAEGLSLWYHTIVGNVGDVGYIRDGYFNKVRMVDSENEFL